MNALRLKIFFCALLATSFTANAWSQHARDIDSMKLLTADVGWAATHDELFWTVDGGSRWKNITPHVRHQDHALASVFFLNSSTGWALIRCADGINEKRDNACFELASTSNAGETWSVASLKISVPGYEDGNELSGRGWVNFADSQHGWMILKFARSTASSFGMMLKSEDGGKTWKHLPTPPIAQNFVFTTAKDGWIAGGPDHELFVTHTAGARWQRVSLPMLHESGKNIDVDYDVPTIHGDKGLLPVRYGVVSTDGLDASSTMTWFATSNGGRTWKQDPRRLVGLPYGSGRPFPSSIADSTVMTAYRTRGSRIVLRILPPTGGATGTEADLGKSTAVADDLSFVSPERGWIIFDARLFSTANSGTSWVDVSPTPLAKLPTPVQGKIQQLSVVSEAGSEPVG